MINKQDLIILYLSIVLAITQWWWVKDAKMLAYLQGKNAILDAHIEACGDMDGK